MDVRLIDTADKECRVFCVFDNRNRESLLPLIINNVVATNDIYENNNSNSEIHKYYLSTRIYSDCWAAYSYDDFKEKGYLLHWVNHSVFFGSGLFHTNTIEGLWSAIKRISNGFSGLNISILNNMENNGINIKEYLDD